MDKNKTVVVYKSKYGNTKKYAEWIAKELGIKMLAHKEVKKIEDLMQYDTIIYGGGLYAGGIAGFSLIKKNYGKLKDKKVVVFAVGSSSPQEKVIESVKVQNLTDEMKGKVEVVFCRGGLDYPKMTRMDRMMMWMLKKSIEKKKEKDSDMEGIVATYGKKVDFTHRKYIKPIIELVK